MDDLIEDFWVGESLVGQMMSLEVTPDHLNVIEFGRIFRQPLDGEMKIIPSTKSATSGAGNIAQPGDIELQGNELIFVTNRNSSVLRANLRTGEIGRASGTRPVEIYSEWSLVRMDAPKETVYEHRIEWLSKGSEFYKAERKGSSLQITPTDTTEGLREFSVIVERALADGYLLIHSHKSSMIAGGFYDIAVFTSRE